jgi:hypothetical protein
MARRAAARLSERRARAALYRGADLEDALARYPRSEQLRKLLVHGLAFRVDELLGRRAVDEATHDLDRMRVLDPAGCGPYAGLAKVALLRRDEPRAREWLIAGARLDASGQCRRLAAADPLVGPLLRRMGGSLPPAVTPP